MNRAELNAEQREQANEAKYRAYKEVLESDEDVEIRKEKSTSSGLSLLDRFKDLISEARNKMGNKSFKEFLNQIELELVAAQNE